jgi:NAD(P)-dependent dehydrogenase (short-subunit alcohol dehydrogenase family)
MSQSAPGAAHRTVDGRVVLITGGNRGLGLACAQEFAGRGARVAVLSRSVDAATAALESLADPQAHLALAGDVRDQASLDAAVAAVAERYGQLDVVVANAGVNRHGSISAMSGDEYAEVIETNLIGVYRTVSACLPELSRSRGFVLMVSSVAGFAASGGMAAYASAKAGLEMLAHTLYLDLAGRGIGVGTVVPTWISTDMLHEAEQEMPAFAELRSMMAGLLGSYTDGVPGGPLGGSVTPQECAAAIADGVQRRARRIWVPPVLEEIWRLAPLLNGELGELLTLKLLGAFQDQIDQDLAAARP